MCLFPQVTDDAIQACIDRYVAHAVTEAESDACYWWSLHHTSYPDIACIARRYLALPASEVPSERLFSTAGAVVTKRRAALGKLTYI